MTGYDEYLQVRPRRTMVWGETPAGADRSVWRPPPAAWPAAGVAVAGTFQTGVTGASAGRESGTWGG